MKWVIVSVMVAALMIAPKSHGVVGAVDAENSEISPPKLVKNLAQFPLSSLLQRIHKGFAEVHLVVDKDGKASEFIVVAASHEVFAKAALNGLQLSRFVPAKANGDAVPVRSKIRLQFRDRGVRSITIHDHVLQQLGSPMTPFMKPIFSLRQLSELDEVPHLLSEPKRFYPVDEENRFISGSVRMEYYIDRDGKTRLALPLESANPAIVEAAVRSIASMRYEIPRQGNTPMPTRVQQTFVFGQSEG